MSWSELIRAWPGEEVVIRFDRDTRAWMFIAIHSTAGSRSVGGVRLKVYPDPEEGLRDALRLAEGMTSKWAAIDVAYGGAKAVIALSRGVDGDARTALLRRFGRFVASLNGGYGAGPDIGTTPDDMALLATETRYVHCYDWTAGAPYDPGVYTARGTLAGMRAAWRHLTGLHELGGLRVLVQGLGDTGAPLARSLAQAGATVLVNDSDDDRARALAAELGAEVVPVAGVYDAAIDIYAPCAVGATVSAETIPRLRCRVIAGCANNQLHVPEDAELLHARGILYAPDYVVNGGGAVSLAMVDDGAGFDAIEAAVDRLDERLTRIFEEAASQDESPVHAAARMVERNLRRLAEAARGRTAGGTVDQADPL
jgi:leucine dehydrogenase